MRLFTLDNYWVPAFHDHLLNNESPPIHIFVFDDVDETSEFSRLCGVVSLCAKG